jgi:hypothetical protein
MPDIFSTCYIGTVSGHEGVIAGAALPTLFAAKAAPAKI